MTSLQKTEITNNCYMKKNPADGIFFPVCDKIINPTGGNTSALDLLVSNLMSGTQPTINTLEVPTIPNIDNTNLLFSNSFLKENKNKAYIQGLRIPKIKLEEHQDYIAYKESVYLDDKKNVGIVFPDLKNMDKMIVTNDVNKEINKIKNDFDTPTVGTGIFVGKSMGGGGVNYYEKYMKYKLKYLRLKAENILI